MSVITIAETVQQLTVADDPGLVTVEIPGVQGPPGETTFAGLTDVPAGDGLLTRTAGTVGWLAEGTVAIRGTIAAADLDFAPAIYDADGNVGPSGSTGAFVARGQAGSNTLTIAARAAADAQDRFIVDSSGKHQWGPGNAAVDTNLYRSGVNSLHTDGGFVVGGSLTVTGAITTNNGAGGFYARNILNVNTLGLSIRLGTDTNDRLSVYGDGKLSWGPGNGANDTALYRNGAGTLKTDGGLTVGGNLSVGQVGASSSVVVTRSTSSSPAFVSLAAGDAQNRYQVNADGKHQWGDGTNASDTTLARTGAGTLQVGSSTQAGRLNVLTSTAAGVAFGSEVGGDASMRFLINGAGSMFWGDGVNPSDTMLYRNSAGWLMVGNSTTNGRFGVISGASTNASIDTRVGGDATSRFLVSADGKHQWGDGTNALDTFLYRQSAAVLRTDGAFAAAGNVSVVATGAFVARSQPASTQLSFVTRTIADAADRFQARTDGLLAWGDGTNALDTTLYRFAASTLGTDQSLRVGGNLLLRGSTTQIIMDAQSTSANNLLTARAAGDTSDRFRFHADGRIEWGPGNAATDSNLYRSGVGILKTDGAFVAASSVSAGGTQITSGGSLVLPKRTDPGVSGAALGYVYLRDNGVGKMQLVVQMPSGAPIVLATEA